MQVKISIKLALQIVSTSNLLKPRRNVPDNFIDFLPFFHRIFDSRLELCESKVKHKIKLGTQTKFSVSSSRETVNVVGIKA